MALNIKSPRTEQVVRELAKRMGVSITDAVHQVAEEKLQAIEADKEKRKAALRAIIAEGRSLPIMDTRSDEEILGYNDRGTFE
jgi:antitoxin VapB